MNKKILTKKTGRKQFDGRDEQIILQKLEHVFSLDGTDQEACLYAGISTSAFYEYQKRNPQFLERKAMLKGSVVLRARRTIVENLNDPKWAWKFLERREPGEYGPPSRQKIRHDNTFRFV